MPTVNELKETTNSFFKKHWDKNSSQSFPLWSESGKFFGQVPYNESAGCYAWLKGEEVMYVGVALKKGTERYKGHSTGSRIKTYWRKTEGQKTSLDKRLYSPSESLKVNGVDAIITLPFTGQKYLAIALEYYLIQELSPLINKIYKKEKVMQTHANN